MAVEIVIRGDNQAAGALNDAATQTANVGSAATDAGGKFGGFLGIVGGAGAAIAAAGIGALVAGLADVSARAAEARNILQGINDVDLADVLADASLLQSRYGVEQQEVFAATRTLMEEFGISAQEANALVVSGFENGLNSSGDFLDSIGEYSNLMADNGFAAEEFFSVMQSGLAGGALGTDKAADAFKEFGILVREMPEDIWDTLTLNLDMTAEEARGFLDGMHDGTISVADAFETLMPKIAAIEDPIIRNTTGIKFFGTQWEDLGESAMLAIDTSITSMEDLNATAEDGRNRIASFGEIGPRVWGMFSNALLPVNDAILGFVNAIMGADDPVAELGNQITGLAGRFTEWIQNALPGFASGLAEMGQRLGAWVVEALPGLLGNLMQAQTNIIQWVLNSLPGWASNLAQLGQALLQWVVDALPGLGTLLGEVLATIIRYAGEFIAMAVPKLIELGVAFVQWVATEVLPNLPGMLVQILTAIVTGIGNIISAATPELVRLGTQFITWVTTEVIPTLPGKIAEIGTTIVSGINAFITNVQTEAGAVGQAIIDGIANAITGGLESIKSAAREAAGAALDAAKDFLGIESPSRVFAASVGLPVAQGMAAGIAQGAPLVADAAGRMAQGGLDGARAVTGTVNMGGVTINQSPGERGDQLADRTVRRVERSLTLRRI